MILIDIAPAYYKLQEEARITCTVLAYPKPNITWTFSSCPVESTNCTALDSELPVRTIIFYQKYHRICKILVIFIYFQSNYFRNNEISDIYFNSTVTYKINESGLLYCKACNILGCERADHEIWVTGRF